MKLTEKMSYLQGLLDGLDIDNSTKEGKALVQMTDVMSELVAYVEDLQSQVDELTELCDILDQDLGQVEDDIYDEDDEEFDFDDDDELYEITCPSCGDTILIDEGMIEEGSINCPNCNELLEFDCDDLTIEDFENAAEEAEEKKG